MKTYTVLKGTLGKLIIQDQEKDIKYEKWVVRKKLHFTENQVVVNPTWTDSKIFEYPKGSLAEKMAAERYVVFFNAVDNLDKYLLAIKLDDLDIQHT